MRQVGQRTARATRGLRAAALAMWCKPAFRRRAAILWTKEPFALKAKAFSQTSLQSFSKSLKLKYLRRNEGDVPSTRTAQGWSKTKENKRWYCNSEGYSEISSAILILQLWMKISGGNATAWFCRFLALTCRHPPCTWLSQSPSAALPVSDTLASLDLWWSRWQQVSETSHFGPRPAEYVRDSTTSWETRCSWPSCATARPAGRT